MKDIKIGPNTIIIIQTFLLYLGVTFLNSYNTHFSKTEEIILFFILWTFTTVQKIYEKLNEKI